MIKRRKPPEFKDEIFSLITNSVSNAHGKGFISDPKAFLHQSKHGKFMSGDANRRQHYGRGF